MEELAALTGSSRTTLWRALTSLVERGLVETTRTKRNFGKLYKNKYRLIKVETSTASYSDNLTTSTTVTTKVIHTSYVLGAAGPEEEEKMVNKWTDDDGGVGGVGLFDSELLPAQPKVSKRDPKTRYQRPQEEWTAGDVASEFAYRVYQNVRGIPGLVNTQGLRGALSANRAKFGITANTEMELLEKFFGDSRNMATIKKFPKKTHGIFLNFITENIQSVTNPITIEDAHAMAADIEQLVASDGRTFDKSITGRVALERYEKKLKGEQ